MEKKIEKMYTVKEGAKILNVHEVVLRNRIRAGKIKAIKYTHSKQGNWYIAEKDLQEYIESNK